MSKHEKFDSEELDKLKNMKMFKNTRKGKKGKPTGVPNKKKLKQDLKDFEKKKTAEAVKSRQNKNKKIVWKPFPALEGQLYSSQEMFLNMDHIDQVLYTGSRYIGKSDALVASFVKHVGRGFNERWRGCIVRVTYKALQDILKKAKKMIFAAYSDKEVKFLAGDQMKFVWATGEELHFRSCANEKDYEDKFHGQEYPWIGIDELTSWADSTVYDALMSCNRCDYLEDVINPPVMMRATTNPSGKGRNWVKSYFIDPKPIGQIISDVFHFDGDEIINTRVAINGNWQENPYADKKYIAKLFNLEKTDYPKFRAWLFGDWDVVLGGMFGDLWKPHIHMLEPFDIPKSFHVDRSYDDGTTDPYSCLFWAQAQSNVKINRNGEVVTIPEGSLILINEIYGADPTNPKKGLYQSTKHIAEAINQKEYALLQGLLKQHSKINPGPADYMIWANAKVKGVKTTADKFKQHGLKWQKAKKHGEASRIQGVRIFQDMLLASSENDLDSPHFYVFNVCRNFISNVINLQRDEANPDDIDQTQPDHDWDACRYRITKKTGKVQVNY